MRTQTLLLTFLLVAGLPASALAQKKPAVLLVLPAPSEWKGHSGTLDVTSVVNGVITATYTSNDAACGQTPVPITGKLTPPRLAFATIMPACKSILAWKGIFTDRALALGIAKTTINPDGTVTSGSFNGDLFSRTK